jgi:hypothetical protein
MNAGRLHAFANAVHARPWLAAINESLQRLVSNPSDQTSQQALSTARQANMDALTTSSSVNFPPIWRQSLDELGLSNILGLQLLGRVDGIFARNHITPRLLVMNSRAGRRS